MARLSSRLRKRWLRWHGANIAGNVTLARRVEVKADSIEIGEGCFIGEGVQLVAKRLRIGAQSYLAQGVSIKATEIDIGYNCILFSNVRILSLAGFHLGDYGKISKGATLKAGAIDIGSEFWMNAGAEIGGGGWRNSEGRFTAGHRCHVGRNTHINVALPVSLGDDTAVGMDCTLATHAHWQPITEGYAVLRGPITLGSDVAIYTRSIINPGVTVGNGSAVGAGSVVTHNVGVNVLVAGAPAKLLRAPIARGGGLPIIIDMLKEYVQRNYPAADFESSSSLFRAGSLNGKSIIASNSAECLKGEGGVKEVIFLSFDSDTVSAVKEMVECVFDVRERKLYGRSSELSESLRTMFFSAGVRFSYCAYKRRNLNYQEMIDSGVE